MPYCKVSLQVAKRQLHLFESGAIEFHFECKAITSLNAIRGADGLSAACPDNFELSVLDSPSHDVLASDPVDGSGHWNAGSYTWLSAGLSKHSPSLFWLSQYVLAGGFEQGSVHLSPVPLCLLGFLSPFSPGCLCHRGAGLLCTVVSRGAAPLIPSTTTLGFRPGFLSPNLYHSSLNCLSQRTIP